jgi:hypothetical protein
LESKIREIDGTDNQVGKSAKKKRLSEELDQLESISSIRQLMLLLA